MSRKRLLPKLNLDRPIDWLSGGYWPSDDGQGFGGHGASGTYACWECKVTAKDGIRKPSRQRSWTKGAKHRELYHRAGICQHCGQRMTYMGNKWRPGPRGKWLTQEETMLAKMRNHGLRR